MRLTEGQLRRIIAEEVRQLKSRRGTPRLSSILFEEMSEEEATVNVEKGLDIGAGPSEVIQYLNGPGADPRVRAVLSMGSKDGEPGDEKASPATTSARIGDLVPTQREIELTKSIAYPLSSVKSMKKMSSGGTQRVGPPGNDFIVINGNLIIDGHHRWSSLFAAAGPDAEIAAIDLGMPESGAAEVLAAVQVAIASTLKGGEKIPAANAGESNILGKSAEGIKSLIESSVGTSTEAGEILSDDFVKQCMEDEQLSKHLGISDAGADSIESAREAIISKVAGFLSQMNQPADGSPPRVDMPQIDKAGGGVKGLMSALASGDVNYKPPFAPAGGEKNESRRRSNDQVVLERWQKLAGLIKG